ncbi:two-component regulator propeller domain-containing protein [Spirosoma jeollabukense]
MTRYMAGGKGKLTTNEVLSIHEDKAGIIWIDTHLGGLNRFDWRTGLFSVITRQEGIPGTSIVGITSDGAGNLWLSTNEGICQIDPTPEPFIVMKFRMACPVTTSSITPFFDSPAN